MSFLCVAISPFSSRSREEWIETQRLVFENQQSDLSPLVRERSGLKLAFLGLFGWFFVFLLSFARGVD